MRGLRTGPRSQSQDPTLVCLISGPRNVNLTCPQWRDPAAFLLTHTSLRISNTPCKVATASSEFPLGLPIPQSFNFGEPRRKLRSRHRCIDTWGFQSLPTKDLFLYSLHCVENISLSLFFFSPCCYIPVWGIHGLNKTAPKQHKKHSQAKADL